LLLVKIGFVDYLQKRWYGWEKINKDKK